MKLMDEYQAWEKLYGMVWLIVPAYCINKDINRNYLRYYGITIETPMKKGKKKPY